MLTYAQPPAAPAPPGHLTAIPPTLDAGDLDAGDRLRSGGQARRRVWAWVRVIGGLGILVLLLWRVGAGGFLDGLRMVNGTMLLAAAGIGLLTTVLSAWRWCLVARGLGIKLSLASATADYYRALFLNAALPGGILGDVHRAVRHGRDVGDLGLGMRAVVLERSAGQVVVVTVGVGVLLALAPPALSPAALGGAFPALPPILAAGLAAAGVAVLVLVGVRLRWVPRQWTSRWAPSRWAPSRWAPWWARACRTGGSAVRHGLLARRVWPGIVFSSTAVLAGYLATFLLAARAAGVTAPASQLLPLLVVALLAMALPVNVGGWGPREGACAWAFAAAGLGATQGLTTAVVYGVSVFVASLPGAGVLVLRWLTHRLSLSRAPRLSPEAEQGAPVQSRNRSDSA